MELNTESHRFAQNSSFTFATNLYVFDRELRSLIFTAIQDIEIAFRTRIIHYFSMEHGPFWFMDASKFKNQSIFNSCLDNIATEVNRSKEDFISEYYNSYTAPISTSLENFGGCFLWYTIQIVLQLQRQLCQEEGGKRVSTSTISIFRELDKMYCGVKKCLRSSCSHLEQTFSNNAYNAQLFTFSMAYYRQFSSQ